ncbi:hypothetical protein AND_003324 [Anopheles darlingi]|uniref:Uncharacterized protein n=1 Tax=Anopheles darlingi TaxID=43151 RepID=W5JPX8_ANODA|nr:hypothetical protein AND_003324 [Anopheles darlingi]
MSVADNFTDFMSGTSFVFRMAVDEYNSERNWTGLLDRYWLIVEELIAGGGGGGVNLKCRYFADALERAPNEVPQVQVFVSALTFRHVRPNADADAVLAQLSGAGMRTRMAGILVPVRFVGRQNEALLGGGEQERAAHPLPFLEWFVLRLV